MAHPPMRLRVDLSRTRVADYLAELAAAGIAARAVDVGACGRAAGTAGAASSHFRDSRRGGSRCRTRARSSPPLLDAQARHAGARCLCRTRRQDRPHARAHARSRSVAGGRHRCAAHGANSRQPGAARSRRPRWSRPTCASPEPSGTAGPSTASCSMRRVPRPASSGGIRTSSCCGAPTDIAPLAETQLAAAQGLFFACWRRADGCSTATCSVLPAENEAVLAASWAGATGRGSVRQLAIPPPGALPRTAGFQLLPGGAAGADGFYYACVEKTTAGTPEA